MVYSTKSMAEISQNFSEKPNLVPNPEQITKVETKIETDRPPKVPEVNTGSVSTSLPDFGSVPAPIKPPITEFEKKVESVLEEGLEDIYLSLNPAQQSDFRKKGEETAKQISAMLHKVKIKVKDIFRLVREWLLSIPGVNKYYLEKVAKIKADKILRLK